MNGMPSRPHCLTHFFKTEFFLNVCVHMCVCDKTKAWAFSSVHPYQTLSHHSAKAVLVLGEVTGDLQNVKSGQCSLPLPLTSV